MAMAHLDSALQSMCLIHPDCLANESVGRACFSAQLAAHLKMTMTEAAELTWAWGLHCPRCRMDRRRGHRRSQTIVCHRFCPRSRAETREADTPEPWRSRLFARRALPVDTSPHPPADPPR